MKYTTLIIWDKVPIHHKQQFIAVHQILINLINNENLFGGISTKLGSNFAWILSVVHKKT